MLTLVQEQKRSSWHLVSVISLLLFAVAGFAVFSVMHTTAHAQDGTPIAECAGDEPSASCIESIIKSASGSVE